MPISEQVLRELRAVLRRTQDGLADSSDAERFVFEALPELLDEVELARREQAVVGDADRVQHLAPDSLLALRATADGQRPDDVEVPAQLLLDLLDYVAHLQTARVGLRAALKRTNELLVERCSLHDTLLAKDFLALFAYAHRVADSRDDTLRDAVDGLALQVQRLAPLYDDVRRTLALSSDTPLLTLPIAEPTARVLRELAPHVGLTLVDVARLALLNGTDDLVDRFVADPDAIARLRTALQATVPRTVNTVELYPIDPAHSVNVLQVDGSSRVECDHTFVGGPRCGHCGIPFRELQRRHEAEGTRLRSTVQQQVGKAVAAGFIDPAALDAAVKSSSVSVSRPGSDVFEVMIPPPSLGVEQVEVDSVHIPIAPSVRPRIDALVATGRFGRDLAHVAQTLFILGMLTAEGQDAAAHVGDPMLHVSAEALFVRFGIPHEGDARAAQQRAAVLRQLFLDLAEWCTEGDPLRPSFAAALAALPR